MYDVLSRIVYVHMVHVITCELRRGKLMPKSCRFGDIIWAFQPTWHHEAHLRTHMSAYISCCNRAVHRKALQIYNVVYSTVLYDDIMLYAHDCECTLHKDSDDCHLLDALLQLT